MFKNYGIIICLTLFVSFLFFSYDKSMAGYERNMLEFMDPKDLQIPRKEQSKNCSGADCEKNDHAPIPLNAPSAEPMPTTQPQKKSYEAPKAAVKSRSYKTASYKLGSGDKIKITVFDEKDLSDTYAINEEGFISVPLVGDFSVQGKTVQQVKQMLMAKLADGFLINPSVAIEVSEFRPIYIMGEVRDPGQYEFVTDMSVRNAVALAGGFTYRARQKSVQILRERNKNTVFQIDGVLPDAKIEPGDTILVKERFF